MKTFAGLTVDQLEDDFFLVELVATDIYHAGINVFYVSFDHLLTFEEKQELRRLSFVVQDTPIRQRYMLTFVPQPFLEVD